MPTSKELVANRPLTGTELAKIILADIAYVLTRDTMLSAHVAYGRVSYSVRVTMHMDNPAYPEHVIRAASVPRSDNQLAADPTLSAIESTPPLAEPLTADAFLSASERAREITSPNLARLEHSLPVTVVATNAEGHSAEHQVVYPPEAATGVGPQPTDLDVTSVVRGEMMAAGKLKG